MDTFLSIMFILVCALLIGVILVQKGRGGGLAGAFGGAGGHSAFGARTGDMFTWITIVLVALFLVLAVTTVKYFRPPVVDAGQAQAEQADEGMQTEAPPEAPATGPAESAETRPAATGPAEPAEAGTEPAAPAASRPAD